MTNTNGHGPKTAVLYARVSTDEQARSGYSLAQQLQALGEYAAREGLQVLEEVADPGQSGASLERPGMDRVRDLVAAGGVFVVLAQDRDRFAREPAYHYLLRREFEEHGTKIRALNDRGDDSPEGELTDGILDQLAKFERAKTAERTRRGKMRKAREGKIIAGPAPDFGFRYNASRDGYKVDETHITRVHDIFRMVAVEGKTLHAVKRALEDGGARTPKGGEFWTTIYLRERVLDDVYKPHTIQEVNALVDEGLMAPEVASRLEPDLCYGIWWYNRRRITHKQVSEKGSGGRRYRRTTKTENKPRSEWIAVPVPDAGVPREWVDVARHTVLNHRQTSRRGRRFWELSGGLLRCPGWDVP
jgi:site-specific DNA recombinase